MALSANQGRFQTLKSLDQPRITDKPHRANPKDTAFFSGVTTKPRQRLGNAEGGIAE